MTSDAPKVSAPQIKSASKFLSLLLRHRPETIGLELDRYGWANIDDLISRANAHGKNNFTRDLIAVVVKTNTKQRFAISDDGERIRANQGHSIEVDLGFKAVAPPGYLYHGTATRFLDSILVDGLNKRTRQHVHMAADKDTAVTVGSRHGKPIVLTIDAAAMQADGHEFFRSENGVWLTNAVPANYLSVADRGQ